MKSAILTIVLLTTLAACGSKTSVNEKNASVEKVANKVAEVSKAEGTIQPGKWQSTMTVEEMNMPGMPAETQDRMKDMFAQAKVSETGSGFGPLRTQALLLRSRNRWGPRKCICIFPNRCTAGALLRAKSA